MSNKLEESEEFEESDELTKDRVVKYEFKVEDEAEEEEEEGDDEDDDSGLVEVAEEEFDDIVCAKKNKSILSILTFSIHLVTQLISLLICILNFRIIIDVTEVASVALRQFNRTIPIFVLECFMALKIVDVDFFSLVEKMFALFRKNSYSHWHMCRAIGLRNFFLNFPSEVFVFIYVNSFNFNSNLMVVSR